MDENPYEPSQSNERRIRRPRGLTLNPRDMFGVVVRGIGVYWLSYAVWSGAGIISPDPNYARFEYFMGALPPFIIGGILFLAAEFVVSLAYGSRYEFEEVGRSDSAADSEG